MFAKIGATVVNLNDVRCINRSFKDPTSGQGFLELTWRNGFQETIVGRLHEVEAETGTVLPADLGCKLIEATEQDDRIVFSDLLPVIAFRIRGASNVTPITPNGAPKARYGIVLPDGACLDGQTRTTSTQAAWKKALQDDLKARLKAETAEEDDHDLEVAE